jgi:sigma-E factor negative regulatory protein RseB
MRQLVLSLCLSFAGMAYAAPGTPDALALLERSRLAAERLDYTGVFVRQRGNEVSSARITHARNGKPVQEKLENLDGEAAETLRRGGELVTYLPVQKRMVIESRAALPGFPAILAPDRELLSRYYTTRFFDGDRVAGRTSTAIALDPRDAYRFGYRFWVDTATGLLLRSQRVNEKGEVVEQVAFTQLVIGSQPASRLKTGIGDTRGWQVDNLAGRPIDLSRWVVPWVPGGFRRVAEMTRTLDSAGGRREVAQILYSDGLAGLSIFIEPWRADRSASPLQLGALNMLGKRHGKFWLTIVGEMPMASIRQVADAVELAETLPK